jgi:hypothetical protein
MAYSIFPFAHALTPIYPYATDRVSGQFVSEQNTRALHRLLFKSFCNPGGFTLGNYGNSITISAGSAQIRGYCVESTRNIQIQFLGAQAQADAGLSEATVFHVWLDIWGESGAYSVEETSNLPDAEFMVALSSAPGHVYPYTSIPAPIVVNIGSEIPDDANTIGGCLYLGSISIDRSVINPVDYAVVSVTPAPERCHVLTAEQLPAIGG